MVNADSFGGSGAFGGEVDGTQSREDVVQMRRLQKRPETAVRRQLCRGA
jgi:hypothetical protein